MELLLHVVYVSSTLGVGAALWNYRVQGSKARRHIKARLAQLQEGDSN